MKCRKKKQPSRTMRPSRASVWKRAARRFQLTPEEVTKAKTAGFTPTLMDEVATGQRIRRRVRDKLPMHAAPGQIRRIKDQIEERYAKKIAAQGRPESSPAPRDRRRV